MRMRRTVKSRRMKKDVMRMMMERNRVALKQVVALQKALTLVHRVNVLISEVMPTCKQLRNLTSHLKVTKRI